MRRTSSYSRGRNTLQVQMTPMIDVVFQLLVFFVCTAGFMPLERALPTSLSMFGSGASEVPPPDVAELEDVLIRITAHDHQTQWTVNDRPYTDLGQLADVLRVLARLRSDLPVILDVAPNVEIGNVIDVYDLCRVAGFQKVQFAARAPL